MELQIAIGFFVGCILLLTVFRAQFKGDMGELVVAYMLKGLDKKKYVKLHDIKLSNPSMNTKTVQIDHLIVSTYGIFCIETKAYKGKIYGSDYSRQWTQALANGNHQFMNPIFQNYGHIKAIEALLADKYPNMAYFSIIAFSEEANLSSIDVKNATVCKLAHLSDVIKNLSVAELMSEELQELVKLIEANKVFQTDFFHKRDIKKIKKTNKKKLAKTSARNVDQL